ncbi:unnamed protein product (macronuclear) [Paramecium tetraurelia]|uniref:Uncharacterized protein n=1 Tax=Paramecium tetraurelia TaxID=5888 RepID=A0EHW0_PARTE|nr:uncharacterized protein GSPATT00027228001 [Paramecium tetraurelia]CAK94901.1 unnamed protein product [Paramecium tetraurelia]|eukprot:XP_001462274.1 hypothetical protein (macronuclear) [Paramecium tetraurelia strain d4-2]
MSYYKVFNIQLNPYQDHFLLDINQSFNIKIVISTKQQFQRNSRIYQDVRIKIDYYNMDLMTILRKSMMKYELFDLNLVYLQNDDNPYIKEQDQWVLDDVIDFKDTW